MENCTIQEITYIDELKELCLEQIKSIIQNAINYDVDKMQKEMEQISHFY